MTFLKTFLTHRVIIVLFRVIIGAIFIWASLDKIAHASDFSRAIHNYRIMPVLTENIMAISLPWLELLAGLFLIIGYRVRGAATVISALLMIFIMAITVALLRGLDISCGCFDTQGGAKIGLDILFQDLLMLVMSGSIALAGPGQETRP
ncbi:MAG: MauE/DoxX family redox-associated membrane protein [Acidobacteriota bacterium]